MKSKFLALIPVVLIGLMIAGFAYVQIGDPNADVSPSVNNEFVTSEADTIPPAGFPYPTAFNFNYTLVGGVNGGTVGAMWLNGKYYLNRWNSTMMYRYNDNGPGGGPGTIADSFAYIGSCRDLTTDGTYLYGGPASTLLYRIDPNNGATLKTFTLAGGSTRAVAWDPNRKGFWNTNFGGNIFFHDTNGVLKTQITSTLAGKYGMGWDSTSSPDSAFLWVWNQGTGSTTNELYKIHIGSGLVKASYIFTLTGASVGIAGGAEVVIKNNQLLLLLNFQNQALVGKKMKNLAPAGYFNNFESYTVGNRLACSDSLNWTTWSILPCSTVEDPVISNTQAYSPTKSVKIVQNNDLVKRLGNDSTGIHEISIKFFVPSGKAGYWNTLSVFAGTSSKWGMECYFDVAATGNNGRLFGGSATAIPFAYTHDAWQTAKLIVNLDLDSAKFLINGSMVHKWKWTAGANGVAVPKKLGGNNFFGATATDELYVDDYSYMPGANWLTGITQNSNTLPTEYSLTQNYPNPFNPTTKINFALPKSGLVTMKVYDVLGKEVATLVNGNFNAGSYTVDFNASSYASGVYFYRLDVNGFTEVKRMMLVK